MHLTTAFGQLDTIHWLPPMHAREEWGPQYLYLSTPETQPFQVNIRTGTGTLIQSVTISNAQPVRYDLGASSSTYILTPEPLLQIPLKDKGLILDGPKKFYAYFRAHAASGHHAGDLTCKGRAALGTQFRIGHLIQEVHDSDRRGNFIGFMATEDSTVVRLSDFDTKVKLHYNGTDLVANGQATVVLNKGESAVIAQYIFASSASQPPNGLMGALLSSNKPIAVNCGSWCGAPVQFQAHDIGIDQIAPWEQMGKEYILCKGNGSEVLEHPIVIAHVDGTKVWLNGNAYPAATLNAGDYLEVPTNAFSLAGNLYIRSSEPVFVYQMIGGTAIGDDAMRTAGLIFVPPISCGIPNAVDNIYEPNLIGAMRFEGGLMITAMRDSAITVRKNGIPVPLGPPGAVPGMPDFVTYRNLNLFSISEQVNTLSVTAEGAVQVAMFGRNEPASFAAFYSGFSKTAKPNLTLTNTGDGVCPDTLIASGLFDGVQWMYEDSVLSFGPDTFLITYVPGRYIATGYLGVCRRTDFAADTVEAVFTSPQFPYKIAEPTCFGFSDGAIKFGAPYGGFPPYQFSVDHGATFSTQPAYAVPAGDYQLVVRDSTGCYNKPLSVHIGQPDSIWVKLYLNQAGEDIFSGGNAAVTAIAGQPVLSAQWAPADSTTCNDCLYYHFSPRVNTWVSLTVTDPAGCPATDRILVQVVPNVYAPNVFSPEGTGENAHFTLFSKENLPIRRMAIYDRWGSKVFEQTDFFTNNPHDGWDGFIRGRAGAAGVYVFWAEVEILPGRFETIKGDVTLIR